MHRLVGRSARSRSSRRRCCSVAPVLTRPRYSCVRQERDGIVHAVLRGRGVEVQELPGGRDAGLPADLLELELELVLDAAQRLAAGSADADDEERSEHVVLAFVRSGDGSAAAGRRRLPGRGGGVEPDDPGSGGGALPPRGGGAPASRRRRGAPRCARGGGAAAGGRCRRSARSAVRVPAGGAEPGAVAFGSASVRLGPRAACAAASAVRRRSTASDAAVPRSSMSASRLAILGRLRTRRSGGTARPCRSRGRPSRCGRVRHP